MTNRPSAWTEFQNHLRLSSGYKEADGLIRQMVVDHGQDIVDAVSALCTVKEGFVDLEPLTRLRKGDTGIIEQAIRNRALEELEDRPDLVSLRTGDEPIAPGEIDLDDLKRGRAQIAEKPVLPVDYEAERAKGRATVPDYDFDRLTEH